MTPDLSRHIEDLFRLVRERKPDERSVLLEGFDPLVRSEIERMLAQVDPPPADAPEAGTKTIAGAESEFGPYKILALIGAGGMGTVYRAADTRLGRMVALKITAARHSERFEREARAISALNHPHICTLYDVGPNYLVMELLEGSTLAETIKLGPLPFEDVVRFGSQLAGALAEAHAHGIVHRDLKPGNIMITRHGVKVLDFGIAKMFSEASVTETRAVMGTPAYMAPEQVEGREADARTDLFAFGLVLYEMSIGRLPFPGASLGRMLASGAKALVPPPSRERAELPPGLDSLVAELMEKDPERRCQSAGDAGRELSALASRVETPAPPMYPRSRYLILAAAVMVLLIGIGGWFYRQAGRRRWVREEAVPQIAKLGGEGKPLAAFVVLRKAEQYLPGDPELARLAQSSTRLVSVESTPPGAAAAIQDYFAPDGEWLALGNTPLRQIRVPSGYFRWKLSQPGKPEFVAAPPLNASMKFEVDSAATPAGMVHVPAGRFADMIDFVGWLVYSLPAFDIDRYEVTNRQYQEFVDQGGYRRREFWKEKFVRDGKELSWDQAMDLFRDPTGRSGPSTWEGGHYPAGQENYPVSGVSWYEAAAFATFAGKSLPAVAQWYKAAPVELSPYSINQSNFSGKGLTPVGASHGVGPYGTSDMSGNVREWCLNLVDGDRRFILGGAWRTQTYQAYDPEALPPLDRSPLNGIRCVRNQVPLSAAAAGPLVRHARDFSKAKPASDDVFRAYKAMYAYDKRPLGAKSEGAVEDTADWTKEKITIDAGYEAERLPVYLFLPKNVHPPFQTVVFFASARVNTIPSSQKLGDMEFVDYVIKSGRALVYPIYEGTYERHRKLLLPGQVGNRDIIIQVFKEMTRSIDYLETRPDIDKSRLAYLGVSQGTAYGVIFVALEDRFKTAVFLDGGFFLRPALPGIDQVDFAPRVKKPVLMVNGRYDFTFSVDRAQLPLFRMLGTPEANKRHVIFETPHNISQQKADLSREVLAWLDAYLGRIN